MRKFTKAEQITIMKRASASSTVAFFEDRVTNAVLIARVAVQLLQAGLESRVEIDAGRHRFERTVKAHTACSVDDLTMDSTALIASLIAFRKSGSGRLPNSSRAWVMANGIFVADRPNFEAEDLPVVAPL
jgi:hypothetical protein